MKRFTQHLKSMKSFLAVAFCVWIFAQPIAVTAQIEPDSPALITTEQIFIPAMFMNYGSGKPPTQPPANPVTYYLSPTGSDFNSGLYETQPWASFDHAWEYMYPGDTLILLDGVYYHSLNPNRRNGEPGKPITIRAKNDGQAIIDGQYERIPVKIGDTWPGPIGNYFVIEGIVARNSSEHVYQLRDTNHNILRRVSGYNANPDGNYHVFTISLSQYTLVEDCIAAGSGRKMAFSWGGDHNIIRRCFADWQQHDMREHCSEWPWGEDLNIYNSSDNIIENSISYGATPRAGLIVLGNINSANGDVPVSNNNRVLGVMSMNSGMLTEDSVREFGLTRPQPSECNTLAMLDEWGDWRAGFLVTAWGDTAQVKNTLFQDIFARGNAGLGFSEVSPLTVSANTTINRATILNNGLDGTPADGGIGNDVVLDRISHYTISNSFIEGTQYQGEGARFEHRYVDGVLLDGSNGQSAQALWPWPMQNRILTELGIDVTGELTEVLRNSGVSTGSGLPAPIISEIPPARYVAAGDSVTSQLSPVLATIAYPTPGAIIRYSTDGSEPDINSSVYSGPIQISTPTILKAKAFFNGQVSFSRSAFFNIRVNVANHPPIVKGTLLPFVSSEVEIMLPTQEIELYGTVRDDTLPSTASQVKTDWSMHSGPAGATIVNPNSLRTIVNFPQAGTYILRLTATDGELSAFSDVEVRVLPDGGVRHNLPGRIESENFKAGGEGIAYHDTSKGSFTSYYRAGDVDLQYAFNDYFGYSLFEIDPGEWVAYDINVLQSGTYTLNARVAASIAGGVFHVELDGGNISGPITIPRTGAGLRTYQTLSVPIYSLPQGQHELRFVADQPATDRTDLSAAINYLEFILN